MLTGPCQNRGVQTQNQSPPAVADSALQLIDSLTFPLASPSRDQAQQEKTKVAKQLQDYILPKLTRLDSPLTLVLGGSTGAGKSTLVNSLLGQALSQAGVIRPTTRQPVLLHRPEDAQLVGPDRLLPTFERISPQEGLGQVGAGNNDLDQLILLANDSLPIGTTLLDAPDFDSVSDRNRALANQLLQAADLWLFVTTAHRYADALPWAFLKQAADRDIPLAVVLNRVPEGSEEELEEDLRSMLAAQGLSPALILTVNEQELDEDGLLPAVALTPLIFWLRSLGADGQARAQLARQSLQGAVRSLSSQTLKLAGWQKEQEEAQDYLAQALKKAEAEALLGLQEASQDGQLLRGEVLGRWQDFLGASDLARSLEKGVGRLRDRISGYFKGQPATPALDVEEALESGLQALILDQSSQALEAVQASWRAHPAGRQLLGEKDYASWEGDYPQQVADSIRAWQQSIMDLISAQGADKRQKARFLSLGVNATALLLMLAVFSVTGGLTGLEAGIAGGSSVLGQKLLEAIFGEDAVRRMTKQAKEELDQRLTQLLADRLQPLASLLESQDLGADSQQIGSLASDLEALAQQLQKEAEDA